MSEAQTTEGDTWKAGPPTARREHEGQIVPQILT